MLCSIIIINYNTKNLLRACLSSVLAYNFNNAEIIVVDNNSQDESVEMLQSEFADKIKLIVNQTNFGFGAANNQAAKVAQSKYLFFLNSDTLMWEDILPRLFGFLETYQQVGIISPQLLLEDDTMQLYAYGKFPTISNSIFKRLNKIKETGEDYLPVDWVSGAALIIRRELFAKLSGFDEKFFMYFEDMDLCQRVKDAGYQVMVSKPDKLVHLGGKSLAQHAQRKRYYYQSQRYFYRKHYGRPREWLMRFLRLPYKTLQLSRQ